MWRKETLATKHDSRHAESDWCSDFYQSDSYEVSPPMGLFLGLLASIIGFGLLAVWLLIGLLEGVL